MPYLLRVLLPLLLVIIFGPPQVPLRGENWPHWRGPNRNDVVQESSGWRGGRWLSGGEAWKARVGEGATSPIVVGDRLYVMGWESGHDQLLCLQAATGKTIWQQSYPCPRYGRLAMGDQGLYSGPTSTPAYDANTDQLFTLSTDGDLACWTADPRQQDDRRVWHLNLYDAYDIPRRPKVGRSGRRDYGYTSSPVVTGNSVIVEVGAKEGTLMAFDTSTGAEQWRSTANDPAGHTGSPALMTVEGVPCIAVHHFNGLLVSRLDAGQEGRTVATYPWKTEFANNVATPAVDGTSIVLTSSYNQHRIARLHVTLGGIREVWQQEEASKVCSPVIFDGHVYWAWRKLHCLDYDTGEVVWQGGSFGEPGSCIATADARLIVWSGRGDLRLIETARRAGQYRELAVLRKLAGNDAWPHIVMAEGRLFCKDRDGQLVCFNTQER